MHPSVHSSYIHNGQSMETTQVPVDRWMDKDVVHIYNAILLSHKTEWNNAICSNVDGPESIILSEVNQTEKDKYHIIYMWNLKKKDDKMILFPKQK